MDEVTQCVIDVVQQNGHEQNIEALKQADMQTLLFGKHLDSMGIVFLVTDLEARLHQTLGVAVSLADERAMSQKTSPFRSVKTLANYAQTLVQEAS